MGQKVNPIGFRLGYTVKAKSHWFAKKNEFANFIRQDCKIREIIKKKLNNASISKVVIERGAAHLTATIHTARPGIVIGRQAEGIKSLTKHISSIINNDIKIDVHEIRKPETDAKLVADQIAQQLIRRMGARSVMNRTVRNVMRLHAQGVKIQISGRIGGNEIARKEKQHAGRVPLHTLKANIDYATSEANTTYGILGIKVWIYKGDSSDDSE
jgi:small subunit ribosomal protein S3